MPNAPIEMRTTVDGWWAARDARLGGVPVPTEALQELGIVLRRGVFVFGADAGRFALDPETHPTGIDFLATHGPNSGRFVPGICERAGGMLRLCFDLSGSRRPRTFDAPAGSRHFLVTYRRMPPRAGERQSRTIDEVA